MIKHPYTYNTEFISYGLYSKMCSEMSNDDIEFMHEPVYPWFLNPELNKTDTQAYRFHFKEEIDMVTCKITYAD